MRRIALFYAVTALFWFSLYTYVPILTPYAEDLGASLFLAGLIAGAYGFTQMLLRIPLGVFSDILNKRKIFLLLSIGMAILSGLGVYLFPNPYTLLVFRGLSGVAASGWVIFVILFSGYYKAEESMKATGLLNSANALGTVAALLAGGFAAQMWGSPYAFLLGAAGGCAALLLSFGVAENKNMQRTPMKVGAVVAAGFREKITIKMSVLAIVSQYITFATLYGFSPIVARHLGADSFQIGLLTMIGTLPGFFISPLAGTFFLRRFGARRTVMGGFALAAAACAAVPFSGSLLALYALQFIGGIGRNLVYPLLMGLSVEGVPPERRATAMGFFQAFYGFGMFIGPTMAGLIGNFAGMEAAFIATGCIGLVGMEAARRMIGKKV